MADAVFAHPFTPARIVDGDTLWALEDRGERDYALQEYRLARINAPGVHDAVPSSAAAAQAATQYHATWYVLHNHGQMLSALKLPYWGLVIPTMFTAVLGKDADNWARWVADITCPVDGANLSDDLLSSGHAVPYTK